MAQTTGHFRTHVVPHVATRPTRRIGIGKMFLAVVLGATLALFPADVALAGADARIAAVQVALRAGGAYSGSIDGLLGPQTAAAMRTYQKRSRLARLTERRAFSLIIRRLARPLLGQRILRFGATGADVVALQFRLAQHGFPSGWFDGLLGRRTEGAVRRFQRWARIRFDGVVGPATFAALGTAPPTPPRFLSSPVSGALSSSFGPRGARFHAGIDMAAGAGTPVVAASKGRIAWAGPRAGGWGNLVVVAHRSQVRTFYAHLSSIRVSVGQRVARGEPIGLVGNTGTVTAPHLHFEVRVRGAAVDPVAALLEAPSSGLRVAYQERELMAQRLLARWAQHYGVSGALVGALAWAESRYRADAVSSAGAKGVMQVTNKTWRFVEDLLVGRRIGRTLEGNVRVGVAYLRYLLRKFHGDERLAVAAYNQGPQSIRARGVLPRTETFVRGVLRLKEQLEQTREVRA
jgi:murein DD-endopeptidase MepM/ murein hydrolase activator NlpD